MAEHLGRSTWAKSERWERARAWCERRVPDDVALAIGVGVGILACAASLGFVAALIYHAPEVWRFMATLDPETWYGRLIFLYVVSEVGWDLWGLMDRPAFQHRGEADRGR